MARMKHDKGLCIAYAAGPGDIVGSFSWWQKGMDDPNQVSMTYSALFFDACRSLKARGVAISSCARVDSIRTEQFYVENLPKKGGGGGIAFHLQQIRYLRSIVHKAAAEGADILVMADSTGHLFPFTWFAPDGMQLIPTLHCTPWPRFKPVSGVQKIINRLNRHIFTTRSKAILSASHSIDEQVISISNKRNRPLYPFLPLYRKALFSSVKAPDFNSGSFNLLFAGRIETDKGVFDLLQIAETLKKQGNDNITIHLCGSGSREHDLRKAAEEKKVGKHFIIHGYCQQTEMLAHINESHAFIVPTRTTFEEGFNQVVAEAILSGRPVITSAVCPALEYVSSAVIEVPPDDVDGYLDAIIRLASDKNYYKRKQSQCLEVQNQFYDQSRSWDTALERIIREENHG
jgi:glycogen synthase